MMVGFRRISHAFAWRIEHTVSSGDMHVGRVDLTCLRTYPLVGNSQLGT